MRGFGSCAVLLLAAMGWPAFGQLFSFGVKAGVPITDAYSTGFVSNGGSSFSEDRFIIGPTAEVHLPFHLAFEVDALYRRNAFTIESFAFESSPTVNEWQVPFLVKYAGRFGPVRPFVDAGVVYRHVSASSGVTPTNANGAGFALGGGVGIKVLRLRIEPEIRYTHWGQPSFSSLPGITSQSDQADFLVGFTF